MRAAPPIASASEYRAPDRAGRARRMARASRAPKLACAGRARRRARATVTALAASGAVVVAAVDPAAASAHAASKATNSFVQRNLIADNASFGAAFTDTNLTNAWGLAAGPQTWLSDNNSGVVTAYSGGVHGSPVTLQLTEPVPGGNPTGQVFNATASSAKPAFPVGGTSGPPAFFIVSSDSIGPTQSPGAIAAWSGGTSFVVEDSPTGGPGGTTPSGAVFKGLAVTTTATAGPELLAADVANGTVDVFDRNFAPVAVPGEFTDPQVPAGFAPFGIQVLKKKVYVSYVMQNATKTDGVPGAGLGFVDVYSVDGKLVRHLVMGGTGSPLDEPWGMAIAPRHFGPFSGKLLVGNLGDGRINVFSPKNGMFMGTLMGKSGMPLTIDGLWGLTVGSNAFGGSTSVVFSAGPNGYADGLVGTLSPG